MIIIKNELNKYGDTFIKFQPETATESIKLMVASDIHLDSPYCDTKLFKKHLDKARDEGAYIILLGDLFDAMQWRLDKRASKKELLQEFVETEESYFNKLVEKVVSFLEPYKDNILLITYGNHETYHVGKIEVDLLRLIGKELNCNIGAYDGFITLSYAFATASGSVARKTIYYTHGIKGNAPVTMGILAHKRLDTWVRDADIVLSGHNHRTFIYEEICMGINNHNNRYIKTVYHLQLPTYKKRDKLYGYSIEKGLPPSPLGAYLLEFEPDRSYKDSEDKRDLKLHITRLT